MPHFLKRLELNGFKSFAQRTVLEFPAGITAIVGPNGSGKSNIVDAVRWLLGEREAKHLRGAKAEDLIFAGTPKKPRMGQAQASLHFENKKRFFPIDFTEVTVMRQVSRSGTNQYFLNKSEILLRDLIDFFAKARLGSRGLVVVTQGNSDVFIKASPRERREMIEEILGLREYQIKKGDAERRLKSSQINLDKVSALTEEILPHLRSLRRQTSRWEKRGSLEEELRNLENQFFGSQLLEINEKTVALQKKIDVEGGQLAVLEKEKGIAEAKQAKVEATQPEERKDLQKIKEQTQSLLEKRSRLEKELGRIEAQLEMGGGRSSSQDPHSAAKLLALINNVKTRLKAGLGQESGDLRAAVEAVLVDIDSVLAKEEPSGMPADLKSRFEKVHRDLEILQKEMLALKDKEGELDKNQEQFYQAFKAAVSEVEAAKDRIEKWELRNRENLFEKERLDLRRSELARQMVQAGRSLQEFSSYKPLEGPLDLPQVEKRIFKLRGDLASIGEIDEALMREARETEARYEFLKKESGDLDKAVADLRVLIRELSEKIKTEFESSLGKINEEFEKFFGLMFGGGRAKLKISNPFAKGGSASGGKSQISKGAKDDLEIVADETEDEIGKEEDDETEQGVEIEVKLPRKKLSSLEVLSGGERSLVGIAAIFALISVSPPPFLVLDEIDAALDERNSKRFADTLKEFSKETQFIVVTHNRATMEVADVLYGVTLNDDGTSKILSLKLE